MNWEKFSVGDTVIVKGWDEMVDEYGLQTRGVIDTTYVFPEEMAKYCGKTATVVGCEEASYTNYSNKGIQELYLDFDDPHLDMEDWHFTADMVRSYEGQPYVPEDVTKLLFG